MDENRTFGNLILNDWDVKGNDMRGVVNGFGLVISLTYIDKDSIEELAGTHFEQEGIGFLLSVYSIEETKKTYCAFTSLQETVFFINSYIKYCRTISEVDEMFASYRISSDTINKHGYS